MFKGPEFYFDVIYCFLIFQCLLRSEFRCVESDVRGVANIALLETFPADPTDFKFRSVVIVYAGLNNKKRRSVVEHAL